MKKNIEKGYIHVSAAALMFGLTAALLLGAGFGWAGDVFSEKLKDRIEDYELVGIIDGDKEVSGAIFEKKATKKQKLFRIGDVFEDGTLMEITPGAVLIRRGEEHIRIRVGAGTPEVKGTGKNIRVPTEITDPTEALSRVLSQEIPPYDPAVEKLPVSKKDLRVFIETIQEGLEDQSVWIPTTFGSSLKLADVDRNLLGRLGLAREDVLVGISGMGLESPDRVSDILLILNRAKVFNFSILRDNIIIPFYYSVS